jgi:AAA+ superfamily predicted ATPase
MGPNNDDNRSDGSPKQPLARYKFKEIKVHSSDEWMADGTKKYRLVFDRYETTHLRVEAAFYNKLFDEEDWDANIALKCFFISGSTSRELCNLTQTRKISKDENVVYIRDSWGNPTPGSYWTKGNYSWEIHIDGIKLGEGKFYIEDVGISKPGENLFFDIDTIKMFEGDGNGSAQTTKTYLSKFSSKDTRYVWSEFAFKNKSNSDYYIEVIFSFSNDAGQAKGKSSRLVYVQPNTAGQIYYIYPAWGSDTAGTWKDDNYLMEVVFMDTLIATVPFKVGEVMEEGGVSVITDTDSILKGGSQLTSSATNKSLDDVLFESLAELNALTGLDNIKTEVNEMVKLVRFYQESGKDILNKFSLHTVFTGNPGTGKTTVARILAKIYRGLGILEKGHLVEVDRQALVAGYVGQTAIKTGDKINEAMGGILFIDEAYSLANESGAQHDFGGESIQVILKRMEDLRGKFGVIVAGYTDNMQDFIQSNPGLRSRFDKYFFFEDYSPDDMQTIGMAIFTKEGVTPDAASIDHLKKYFAFLHSGRDKHFGNARSVRQVIGEVIKNQHLRLAGMKKEDRTPEIMSAIIFDDVKEFEIKEVSPTRTPLGFHTKK